MFDQRDFLKSTETYFYSSQVKKSLDSFCSTSRIMQTSNFHDAQYDQMMVQEELLTTEDQSCVRDNLAVRQVNLNTLNPPNVYRIASGVKNEFYDYPFMQWLACSVRYTFIAQGSLTSLAKPEAVQNFIQSLKAISTSSGAGLVWEASFGGVRQIILLKTPKSLALDIDIYDELSPAEILTLEKTEREIERQRQLKHYDEVNSLEKLLEDLYGKYGNVLDNPVNYLIIENIPGGLTLSDNLKLPTTTFTDVISYLLQLSIALDWALHDHDFCHYDLHTDNVIMRHIGIMGQQTFVEMSFYGQPEVKRKIPTRYIPTIIDYGRSHVSYQNQETGEEEHFGYYLYPQWGIYYNRSRPAYDLYKLVGFIVHEIFKSYTDRETLLVTNVNYSDLDGNSSSTENLTKTIPMSMSDQPLVQKVNLLQGKRSLNDIEDEIESVVIGRRIPNDVFQQMVSLLFFFPFFKLAYGDYVMRKIPKSEIILFVLREFTSARFSIGDRWLAADQEPLKMNVHRQFYNYLVSLNA